jgi:hypothetical protein
MLTTIYDAHGHPFEVRESDARRLLATGEWTGEPPSRESPSVETETTDQRRAAILLAARENAPAPISPPARAHLFQERSLSCQPF